MTSHQYTITTLAPVHIGTGDTLLPLEYHIADRVIVPDLEKLLLRHPTEGEGFSRKLSAISTHDLNRTGMDRLISAIALADQHCWRYATVLSEKRDAYFFSLHNLKEELKTAQAEIRVAIKSPDNLVYIPGSSIKGTLRTAWLYAECIENPKCVERVGAAFNSREAHGSINTDVFQSPYEQRDAGYDLFRILQVGDTTPRAPEETLCLISERVLSASVRVNTGSNTGAVGRFKDYWTFCEAICRNVNLQGRINFDEKLLEHKRAKDQLGWSPAQLKFSLSRLRAAANLFAEHMCQWEIDYFSKVIQDESQCKTDQVLQYYQKRLEEIKAAPDNTLYLSLGHGSGWHKMTIGTLLEKHLPRDKFEQLRRNLKLADQHTDFEYPKSRKLSMSGRMRAAQPLGWVKMVLGVGECTESGRSV